MSKKIGVIGIRGLPANYGAFDTFVDQLIKDKNVINSNIFFLISTFNKNFKKSHMPMSNKFMSLNCLVH